ncbi:hypothetical protein AAG747_28760 [Rapidithrix thailandica]|uniref:Type VI secretion system, VipA, VC_A0107 or Hcp2 n=1 Tax=Rapidithrix thailandica TaxID=413964 RepID=A0AAW9SH46_9BACT
MLSNYGIGGNEVKQDANEAISEIPQNRTLIVQKLTSDAPVKPQTVEGLQTVEQVFEHYKPSVKVNFEDAEGGMHPEELKFSNLADFGIKGATNQSKFLHNLEVEKEQYKKIIKQLKTNKILKTALDDADAKQALLGAIENLIAELDNK